MFNVYMIDKVNGSETYNQTYLDEWIKENGCNCTKEYMEKAARIIDSQVD